MAQDRGVELRFTTNDLRIIKVLTSEFGAKTHYRPPGGQMMRRDGGMSGPIMLGAGELVVLIKDNLPLALQIMGSIADAIAIGSVVYAVKNRAPVPNTMVISSASSMPPANLSTLVDAASRAGMNVKIEG